MMRTEIESKVSEVLERILGRAFGREEFELSRSEIPEWNSLVHVEVIFACEDLFEVEFSMEELKRLISVKSIVDSILDKVG
jgi:acyl carrier protein